MTHISDFQHILVATDFSPHSEAALNQAIWIARQSGAKIVLAHTLPDLRKALLSASSEAQLDIFYGEGDRFQREIREDSQTRMRSLIAKLQATDLDIQCETLLGDPSIALTHAVQKEKYDLVLTGTRGMSAWERFFVGSTAKRLIRQCPSSVWIVKAEQAQAPQTILAAIDFSDVSRRAALQGFQIARMSNADFHLLHVIDSKDIPSDVVDRFPPGSRLREEINAAATSRLEEFLKAFDAPAGKVHSHLSWGIPSEEVRRLVEHLNVDLAVLGTVGRSGIKGVLLGNTAEKILDNCNCSILTVKPENFVSPIDPPFWPLHPESQS